MLRLMALAPDGNSMDHPMTQYHSLYKELLSIYKQCPPLPLTINPH